MIGNILHFTAAVLVVLEFPSTICCPGDNNNNCMTSCCTIRMRSYSSVQTGCSTTPRDEEYGYIVVNGNFVLNGSYGVVPNYSNYRGVNTMILNPTKCTVSDWRQFDTWVNTDGANALVDYLNYLDNGIVILMVSFDESIANLGPAAKLIKLATRVDIAAMAVGSKYAAVIQKGYPHKTAIVTAPPNCFSPQLVVRIAGTARDDIEFIPI